MNHYDDLQRFKDKTRTQSLEFKDLSAQSASRERGDWAILDQLSPQTEKETTLAVGGSVTQVVPQPVSADAFVPHDVAPVRMVSSQELPHETRAPSIMQSVSTQMTPHAHAEAEPTPAPVAKPEPDIRPVTPQADPVPQPAARPPVRTEAPEAVNYSRLFASKSAVIADKAEKEEKDQPLKSLLERIASCR
ncbi:cellulose biosynthesis protein BcsO [Enterobacter sp. CC120223-11]|uniref:cellulose biosynthesis protein BcsO n=1 Tax=Enterobacter sp. CC120223-11 TaxID=1378073 RepID=UPI000BD879CC|nr:cellulose biosynthesis protein BcsO [Enterobacter sp. CC120223-11]SNY66329.1 Cellulose biosynthesis protein BcsO [Enterobacter sp. CC120223-11]